MSESENQQKLAKETLPSYKSVFEKDEKLPKTLRTKLKPGAFDDLIVKTPAGKEVLLKELWNKQPVVLKVLARLGCGACRFEAKALNDIKPILERNGVALVAIAFEDIDLEEFLTCGFWQWDILLDPERQVYQAAGLVKLSWKQTVSTFLSLHFNNLLGWLAKRGVDYNLRGDLRQLGGTFVINQGNFVYDFRPSKLAMFPCTRDIIAASGGDPDDVDDVLPPAYVVSYSRPASIQSTSRLSHFRPSSWSRK